MNSDNGIIYKKESIEKAIQILNESDKEIEEAMEEINQALAHLKTVQSPDTIKRLESTIGNINPLKYTILCDDTIGSTISNMKKSIAAIEAYLKDSSSSYPLIEPMDSIRFVTVPVLFPEPGSQEKVEPEEESNKQTTETTPSTEPQKPQTGQVITIQLPTTDPAPTPQQQQQQPQPQQPQPQQPQPQPQQPQQQVPQYQATQQNPQPPEIAYPTESVPTTKPIQPSTLPTMAPIQPIASSGNSDYDMNNPDWQSPNMNNLSEQKVAKSKNIAPIAAGAGIAAAAMGVTGALLYKKNKKEEEEITNQSIQQNALKEANEMQNYDVKGQQVIGTSQEFKYN